MPFSDPGFVVVLVYWTLSLMVRTALVVIVVVLTLRWVFGIDLRKVMLSRAHTDDRTNPRRVTVNRRDRPLRL
ncbi:MAG TPA: hypothetical protein VGT61_06705 [Thermomicrobiales bacterium]|jgi:hypothetical protein|nr:hypothetical protein [Thermomicrobiales bacterium]